MPERRICVLDAGPIIHLDELGELDLLHVLGKLFVPESVAYEAEKHRPGVTAKLSAHVVEEPEFMSADLAKAIRAYELNTGEVAALAWAEKFGADLFVSDDKAARDAADVLGVESTGTLGVISEAFRGGTIPREKALALLHAIPFQSSLHIRGTLLSEVIAGLR